MTDLAATIEWTDDANFRIGPVTYACRPRTDPFPSKNMRFCLRKPREVVERYEELLRRLQPQRIFEVGLYQCGSTALIAQLVRPEKLIGIDLDERGVPEMRRFATEVGLERSIGLHWGVDQADGKRLRKIVRKEIGSAPLDLVIDDASHLLEQSRATFDALFPLLRPGGEYVLEDWAWAHAPMVHWPALQPLTGLVAEATIACAHIPDVVAGVEIDRPWAVIRRGNAQLDPKTFSIKNGIGERGRRMVDAMARAGTGHPTA